MIGVTSGLATIRPEHRSYSGEPLRCEKIAAKSRSASMARQEKELKQRERWEKMKKQGHLKGLALNSLILAGSCVFVDLAHILCFKIGWIHTPGKISWEDIFIWAAAGVVGGELDWSDLKRKFRTPPPEEDWMVK
jgi:hypothetical protein